VRRRRRKLQTRKHIPCTSEHSGILPDQVALSSPPVAPRCAGCHSLVWRETHRETHED
jgi:hypothetical protein